MKKLSAKQLKMQIKEHFPYFDDYNESEYLLSLDENIDNLEYWFSHSRIRVLYKLDERAYNYEERKTIIERLMREKNEIKELKNIGNILVMLCSSKLKLFPKKIKDKRTVQILLSDIFAYRKDNAVIFTQEELSEAVIMQFLSIPFLLSYQDVYFLPFGQQFFYYCNHHLDLFRVDYGRNDKDLHAKK